MKFTHDIDKNVQAIHQQLPLGTSFDIIEREILVAGKRMILFFIDGFAKDDALQSMMTSFLYMSKHEMASISSVKDFITHAVPYIEVSETNEIDTIVTNILSGPTAIFIEGFDSCILLDVRTYPARGPQEPDKEKVVRGSRDGFVETIVFNTALLRRRIRDTNLIFEMHTVGRRSKTDVAIGYIKDIVNQDELTFIKKQIDKIDIESLVMNEQSLMEAIIEHRWYNPFPKVRFTERPDVAAANLLEGRMIVLVDNSPSAMILPTTIFDYIQDADDFYNAPITGNYIRLIRNFILLATLLMTPLWLLIVKNIAFMPDFLTFLVPKDPYGIPLVVQFILLEFAIDGLKLASLNTPGSLGMSLSVVGALILGEFAVKTGWFIPQTILYMAIIALGSFAQPSMELGYAIKFFRLILLILTSIFNFWGFIAGLLFMLIVIVTNKTATGTSYIYPLYPFDAKKISRALFRVPLKQTEAGKSKK
ncbi:MAG: spore germination protein [Bacillaceae bacterium]